MRYTPRQDYLLVKPEQVEEKSAGGIYIPEQAREELQEGKIVKLGPECSSDLQIGMSVVWLPNSDSKILVDKVLHCLVKETALMATVEYDGKEKKPKKFFLDPATQEMREIPFVHS